MDYFRRVWSWLKSLLASRRYALWIGCFIILRPFRAALRSLPGMGTLMRWINYICCSPCCDKGPPKRLDELGYEFEEGSGVTKLVSCQTRHPFQFVSDKHYEKVGKAVEMYLYDLLESKYNLEKMPINDMSATDGTGFFFKSRDAETNIKGLLVLIHGSGAVRAGQWSRRLIINTSLESGSQLPYIAKAFQNGWAVIVMNTNQNNDDANGKRIRGSESPEEHAHSVWRKVVTQSQAPIAVVAHSYGGVVTLSLIEAYKSHFEQKVCAIAFTDSAHSPRHVSAANQKYLAKVGKNWVRSAKLLDTPQDCGYDLDDCPRVSAGTTQHEETSWTSFDSVFAFIHEKFRSTRIMQC